MHIRLFEWRWACAFCRIPISEGEYIWLLSEPDTRPSSLYRVATHCRSGPRESCRHCKAAATVYSVHLPCLSILHQSTASRISSGDDDWALRCAQAMALAPIQVRQASKPISFAESSENIIEKLCPQTRLSKLLCRIQCTLPVELHALIISFMSDSPGGDVLFSREARAVLSELQSSPEKRHRSISCSGALFARWGSRGQLPSLAGLYEDKLKGSQQIEVDDESWAFIVLHWNDSRITKMEWVGHETSLVLPATNRYTSYQVIRRPKSNLLWITMEGLFISRLDSSPDPRSQRVFWNTPTSLLWKDLPRQHPLLLCNHTDAKLTYLTLEGVRGISIAHCNESMEYIHFHRNEHNSTFIYDQMHEFATWIYCPIDEGEAILGMWLIRSSLGTGLLVKTANKTVWLCSNRLCSFEVRRSCPLLVTPETKAVYYCSCMRDYFSIPTHSVTLPQLELPKFPVLSVPLTGIYQFQWSFSTASFSNVLAVRKSSRGNGWELRYKDFSKTLGDFRPDYALEWMQDPAYFKVSRVNEQRHTIAFFEDGAQTRDVEALPLSGTSIVFWFCLDDAIILVT